MENQAISLNNRGASLIDAGSRIESINVLTCALKSSKQFLLSGSTEDVVRFSLDQMMGESSSCVAKDANNNIDFVHRKPIHLPECDECIGNSILVPIVILFNLALAHHLAGVEDQPKATLLQKAVKLYEHAIKLAKTHAINDDSVLFHLAIVNNMGQIYKHLNQEANAGKCFAHLLSMLMYLLDCSREDATSYEAFLSSVCHRIYPSCCTAAAAA